MISLKRVPVAGPRGHTQHRDTRWPPPLSPAPTAGSCGWPGQGVRMEGTIRLVRTVPAKG